MRQGAPGQGLRRQGLAVPFQAQHLPSGDASDGMIDRKRGAWGHLGALSHEIIEKERNTTPWPVLRSLSIGGGEGTYDKKTISFGSFLLLTMEWFLSDC